MERLSLKELKELNATKEDIEPEAVEEVVDTEEATNDDIEAAEVESVEESESTDESTEEAELEPWMQAEEAENSEDDQEGGFVPNHAVAKVRRKLKAKLGDAKDEIETLRAEIDELKKGGAPAPAKEVGLPPRPKREDFDFNDDAYDTAIDEWNDKKLEIKLATRDQASQQKATQEKQQAELSQSIDDHYEKAAKLVESGKVSEEAYLNADKAVRHAVNGVFGDGSDQLVDRLIHTLNVSGEGSDKVMFQLGVNKSKLSRLEELLRADASGLSASVYLGALQAKIQEPQKRRSSAPKPAAKVDGEGGSGGPEGTIYKQYVKAGKSGDVQSRISLKRKAKAQGVDTSQW